MTVPIQQVANTNTFYFWKTQTNLMANAMSTVVITTVPGPTDNDKTTGNAEITGTFAANTLSSNSLVVRSSSTLKSIVANGSVGTSGQVLVSNGAGTYWASIVGSVTQVNTSGGIKGGPITATGTVSLDLYTDNVSTNTIYPVGTIVPVYTGNVTKVLNSQEQIYLQNLNGVEGSADPSTLLSGNWRNRGLCGTEYRSPTDIRRYYLYQRVA